MEIGILWLLLSFVVAYLGADRKIGGGWAFLWALLLSPAIGFLIIGFSPSLLSIDCHEVQRKQLEELAAIRKSLRTPDQVQLESEQSDDHAPVIDSNEPAIDVSKLTTWQRIKYGV